MTDAGFFKGTSFEQDARFADKKKKLMKTMKFGDNLSQKVDMSRVKLDCIRPWVVKRITELLNFEDEVVCNYVLNQLEERYPDPKEIQINITGFLNSKNARIFLTELWDLLISAMETSEGVPSALLEAKKAEIMKRQDDERQIKAELTRKEEELRQKSLQTISRTIANQLAEASNGNTINSADANATDKTAGRTASRHSRSPSSPRSRRRKDLDRDEYSRRDGSRHRRRHRSSSVSSTEGRDRIKESRRRHRSRSRSSTGQSPKKPPPVESDWRKDLMAGRRRSPPKMPENSYYGHHKERKRSRSRHDRRDRHRDDRSSPRRSPRRRHHRSRGRYESDYRDPDDDRRHRRQQERQRLPSRSPSPMRPEPEEGSLADRVNKYHNRRAQWAQEDDELAKQAVGNEDQKVMKRKRKEVEESRKRERSLTPEGPALPPVPAKSKRAVVEQEASSSSSDSESEESGSSSSDEDSGSDSSAAESSTEGEKPSKPSPEGPAPPPRPRTPEGPALPPARKAPSKLSNQVKEGSASGSSDSSSSSEDSGSEDSGGSSSSEEEEDDSQSEEDTKRRNTKGSSHRRLDSNRELQRRPDKTTKHKRSPEGPDLPPPRKDNRTHRQKSDGKRDKHGKYREDSAEEALRRRALASLIRASGDKRRDRSPT